MTSLALLEQRHADRKQREAEHEARWWALKLREIELGLRPPGGGIREPHAVGSRVLLRYPAREGVVISYEESDKTNGGHGGDLCLVRYASGYETLLIHESLVTLEIE